MRTNRRSHLARLSAEFRQDVVAHGVEPCRGQLPDAPGKWRAYRRTHNCAGAGAGFVDRDLADATLWPRRPT